MIQCYQNRRYDSDFLTTKKVIESGKLGDLLEVEMHYDYYRPEIPNATPIFPNTKVIYTGTVFTPLTRYYPILGNRTRYITMFVNCWDLAE